MTGLFCDVVNMSITAGVLVLVVLLLRLVLKRAPKWVCVLLWGLAAVRLVCPFGVESPLSLMPKTDWIVQEQPREAEVITPDVIDPDEIAARYPGTEVSAVIMPPPEITVRRGINLASVLPYIWLAGMAVMLTYMAVSAVRVHRRIRGAEPLRDNIFVCAVESPFVFGLIRPRICLPSGMDDRTLSCVVAHEQAHIRRKDHWWKPVGFLLLTVHWFNPLIWVGYILLCRDIEMACDERVLRDMGAEERADYSQALLECSVKRTMVSACPLAFGEVGIKARIRSVLHYRKPAFWIVVLAVIACAAVAVCFLTNPIVPPVRSIDDYAWYFERAYNENREKNEYQELYQPGLQPKTAYAYPLPGILVHRDEPMWYDFIMGDWDTDRMGLHFIHERTDSRNAHYTVEIYRDTGELIQGADAVMEPMTDSDGYVLTVYFTRDGYETRLIFTTEKPTTFTIKEPSEAETGNKSLTLTDVIALSAKGYGLTWADFAGYAHTDIGSGLYIWLLPIDETYSVKVGGVPTVPPMYVYLCAQTGGEEQCIDVRGGGVEAFVQTIEKVRQSGTDPIAHWYTFEYDGVKYDLSAYAAGVNGVFEWGRVGKYVIAEGHVNPRNSLFAVINTETKTVEKTFVGIAPVCHSDDINTLVYAFWGSVRAYDGTELGTVALSEPEEYIAGLAYTADFSQIEVTIEGDGETRTVYLAR